MTENLSLLALVLSLSATMLAAPVSQEEALRKASAFVSGRQHAGARSQLRMARRQPGRTLTTASTAVGYYVFNVGEQDGFVIVSGDDRTLPILGYAEQGSFDAQLLPPAVQAWLDGYERELAAMQTKGAEPVAASGHESIAPLIQTHWNQTEPYNNECPVLPNKARAVTGCVPTAMAQLMYYHRWPAATTTEISTYEGRTEWGELGTVHVDGFPAGTTFDWDNMRNFYTVELPEEPAEKAQALREQTAVAHLMRVCGTSVEANYRDSASGGTGVDNNAPVKAFLTYFDYSQMMQLLDRSDYLYADWQDLIYNELKAKRPVIYGGQSSGGGHFFIVDGYDSGLFHVNWGWGGFCDGYFALSIANPGSNEGTGASSSLDGYGMHQLAIVGIKKNEGEPRADVAMRSAIVKAEGTTITSSYFNRDAEAGQYEMSVGYALSDGTYKQVGKIQTSASLPSGWGYSAMPIDVETLADGVYHLVPVSRALGKEKWLPGGNVKANYVVATVAGGAISLEWKQPQAELKATSFNFPGRHKVGLRQDVLVTIHNDGDEFYAPVYFFVGQGTTVQKVATSGITVEAGTDITIPFSFSPTVVGENIILVATDDHCGNVIGQTTLTVKPQGETGDNLSVSDFAYDDDNALQRSVKAFAGHITVTNGGTEEYDGEMFLRLLYNTEGMTGSYGYLKDVFFEAIVPAGATVKVPFTVEGLTPGTYYWPMVCVNESIIWNTGGADIRRFEPDLDSINSVDGVGEVAAPLYNLSGVRVQHPQRGVYVRNGHKIVIK